MLLPSCHIARIFTLNVADVKDYKRFPSFKVDSSDNPWVFKEISKQPELLVPEEFNSPQNIESISLEQYLNKKGTTGFIIVRNDTILYEKYFQSYDTASIMPSFSIAKSMVSALTGIAIKEGYIESVKDPVTKYIDIFKHPGFDKITIEDCLNMRTGIRFNEGYYNPFGEVAKFYYGKNLKKYVAGLRIKEAADINYEYIGANTQILGFIIEKTTAKKLSEYLQEKIWIPMGAEYSASWNYDSKKHKNIKAFCCLNGRLRDFAKFGRLYLDDGNLYSPPIVPPEWIKETYNADKDSHDSKNYQYSYQWRVMDSGALFAKGILGQFIYVNPEKNIVIARFGKNMGKDIWPELFDQITESL